MRSCHLVVSALAVVRVRVLTTSLCRFLMEAYPCRTLLPVFVVVVMTVGTVRYVLGVVILWRLW